MALAIDITDGHGISNEVLCELLLKKSKVMLYILLSLQEKPLNQLYITNKMEHFNSKSGCAMRVAKLIKKLAYSVTVRISTFKKLYHLSTGV